MVYTSSERDAPKPETGLYRIDEILRPGDRGGEVIRLQQLLNAQGASLAVDGVFNERTQAAVIQFQRTRNLPVTGHVDIWMRHQLLQVDPPLQLTVAAQQYDPHTAPHQVHALNWLHQEIPISVLVEFNYRWMDRLPYPEPLLCPGDCGEHVTMLKRLLKHHHYLTSSVDDCFDALTKVAVLRFQHQHGLLDDGIVGPRTWRSLRRPSKLPRLSIRLKGYRPIECPHQKAALIWLQGQLSDVVFSEFSARWKHRRIADVVSVP